MSFDMVNGADQITKQTQAQASLNTAQFIQQNPRAVFGAVMQYLADTRDDLAVLVTDYARRLNLAELKRTHPETFYQCGIAEQNQIEIASALAQEGFCTFAAGYATFLTARTLDQIRVNLGMMRSPVMLVGISAGCESGVLGASHMALEDMANLRAVAGVEVFAPADSVEFAELLLWLARNPRPCYVRANAVPARTDVVYGSPFVSGSLAADATVVDASDVAAANSAAAKSGYNPYKARKVITQLSNAVQPQVALVSTGALLPYVQAAAAILEREGIATEVMHFCSVKPLDTQAITCLCANSQLKLIVSVEEHARMGGFGSAFAEELTALPIRSSNDVGITPRPRLVRLGFPDAYQHADTQAHLLELAGLTPQLIAARAKLELAQS